MSAFRTIDELDEALRAVDYLPDRGLARMWDFEDSHSSWKRFLALHHLFVLRRR